MEISRIFIIEKLIKKLEQKLEEQEGFLASAEKGRKEAPTAMESHSDKTRQEMEKVSENLQQAISEIKNAAKYFEEIKENKVGDLIKTGDLIKIKNYETQAESYYLIVREMGGVTADDFPVTTISSSSPIAIKFIGQKKGDRIKINTEREVEIAEVL